MSLDINTLLIVTVANIMLMGMVSSLVMGTTLTGGARDARRALIIYGFGWMAMILSNLWPEAWQDRLFSTLSVAAFSTSNVLLYRALGHWLGPRPLPGVIAGLAVATPLGYALLFDHYAARVGWSNFLLAAQLALVAGACFGSRTSMRGRWRQIVAAGTGATAVFTAGRGLLGAFTDLYPTFLTPHPWNLAAMVVTNLAPILVNFAVLVGWHEEAESALRQQAVTDSLTRVLNRRGWFEVARPMVAHAVRHHEPLALMMIDLDHFKRINDTYGHEAGDRTLQLLCDVIGRDRRASDVIARVGGEEFCLLLPMTGEGAARELDRRMRTDLLGASGKRLGYDVSFSTGLAMLDDDSATVEALMVRADAAMYAAKHEGRSRLCVAP